MISLKQAFMQAITAFAGYMADPCGMDKIMERALQESAAILKKELG